MQRGSKDTVVQGLEAGVIGYVVVAVFFLILNLVTGRPAFFTAESLGTALLGGTAGAGAVLAFNGVHMVGSLVIGLAAAFLLYETDLHPSLWYPAMFIFVAGFILSSVFAGVFAAELAGAAPWWAIFVANALAGGVAGGFLWTRHPNLADRVSEMAQA